MKSAMLLMLAGVCACAQQQGSLEGTAINSVTREPLAKVHVRLVAAGFTGIAGAYGAMSDRAGHFSIATIRPGTYILLPELAGYLHVQSKDGNALPTITIKPGEPLKGYQLEMSPRAILSGRVLDENGDPVQGVNVKTVAVSPESSPPVLVPLPNQPTDDRGEYRIVTVPGKFYLQATVNISGPTDRPEKRSDGTSEVLYANTYYPSTPRKDRAAVVEAVAGKDVGGLDLRLARPQGGLFINGTVSGIPESPNRPYVVIQWGDKAPITTSGKSTPVAMDGTFKFDSLQPGYYLVTAQFNDGSKNLVSRTLETTLENTPLTGVELTLVGGLELYGKVRVEGEAPGAPAKKRSVKLEPFRFAMGNLTRSGGDIDADGMYRVTGIAPVKYKLKVEPLGDNEYVKAVELDGRALPDNAVDLSTVVKSANANVKLGRDAVTVSGHVLDSNGEKMPTNVVMIFLVKEFSEVLVGNGTTQATPDGKYTLKSVAPGKYKLFAIDAFKFSGGVDAIDALKAMYDRVEDTELKEGEKITKDLRVLVKENPNAKPKQ